MIVILLILAANIIAICALLWPSIRRVIFPAPRLTFFSHLDGGKK